MITSQNGWGILKEDSKYLYDWVVPTHDGNVILPLRRGPAGFVLCHYALWHSERVEPVFGQGDDFGYAARPIAGTTTPSNHWSATAEDLNASKHPSGVPGTFTVGQRVQIRTRLEVAYPALKWGGDFTTTVDEMHFELKTDRAGAQDNAEALMDTSRGRRLLEANPSQERFLD